MTDHEALLQRLVDGELRPEVRHALLQEADANPELWREIGLAFVESQILGEEIGTLFDDETAPSSEQDETSVRPLALTESAGLPPRSPLWAMAATFVTLLALLGSFYAGSRFPQAMGDGLSRVLPASVEPTHNPTSSSPNAQAPYRLLVESTNAEGQSEFLRLPAYDESYIQAAAASRPSLSNSGWEVSWQTDLLTGELQDGTQVYVPVSLPNPRYRGQ